MTPRSAGSGRGREGGDAAVGPKLVVNEIFGPT